MRGDGEIDTTNRFFKRLTFFLFCALSTILWASTVRATEIKIPPLEGKSGQPITIPVMVDRVDNLAGVKMVIKYDPKILIFKKGSKTKHTDSLMHIVNDKKPGLLIVVMAGARGIKGKEFSILNLLFEIKKGIKKKHNTTLEISEVQMMSDKLKNIKSTVKVNPLIILP